MPQTALKHEFFTLIAGKDLLILWIARKIILWISLCIVLFCGMNAAYPAHNVTIFILFFILLNAIATDFSPAGDNMCHVDITYAYFSGLVRPVFRCDFW